MKTWQRYRRGNYVQEDLAEQVIVLLGVEPTRPLRTDAPSASDLVALDVQLRAFREALAALEARLGALERQQDRP